MTLDFGDVVVVPFPFTSQTATKRRPAVIVSKRMYNDARPDVVVMAITSQMRPGTGEFSVSDWHGAGLLKPSVVKPVFATLEQKLIIRRLGSFTADDHQAPKEAMAKMIG